MGRLDGKVCVITGATSGIGEKAVEIFRSEGATVVFSGRRADQGKAIEQTLGGKFIQCDVAREEEVARLVQQTVELYGRIDCFFANAGGPGPLGMIEGMDTQGYHDCMAVNLHSVFYCMKYATPVMKRQGSGSFISTASVAAHRTGYSSSIMYSTAKAAVVHLTRLVAMECGEHCVRVNTISPGAIPTGIFGKAAGLTAEQADKMAKKMAGNFKMSQPIRRSGTTDDIAWTAVFLASDESSFINAQDIVVDGGLIGGTQWTAQQQSLKARSEQLKAGASKL